MSRRISDARLETLHELIRFQVHKRPGPQMILLEGHEISCIVDELRQRRNRPREASISRITVALMSMKVGETFTAPPMPQGNITTLRRTARARMGVHDARWHCETQPDGLIKITRMPDGSPHIFGKPRNPAVAQMAGMRVGQTIILTTIRGSIYNGIKVQARVLLDMASANWRCENMSNGNVRVTRTS